MRKIISGFLLLLFAVITAFADPAKVPPTSKPAMKKFVTEKATFVLYMPDGWKASEEDRGKFKNLIASDPGGLYGVVMSYGVNPAGNDVRAHAGFFANGMKNQFSDLNIPKVMVAQDRKRVVFDGIYTDAQKRRREFRCWVSGSDGNFTCSRIEAPEGQLAGSKPLLLTILSNVQILKGAFQVRSAPFRLPMETVRLQDGSATFLIPRDWKVQGSGRGAFVASDPGGHFSFTVATGEAVTPQVGFRVPNALVSPYLPPHRAMETFAVRQGIASKFQFLQVVPRQDINQQLKINYTAGPASAEEFIYAFTTKGRRCRGYSFGISFGTRLNTNWSLWHMSVWAPLEQFDAFVPNFVTMCQSYKIDDKFTQDYIARGMERLRRMEKETAVLIARDAREIRQMMEAAYDERRRSQEYIDDQRTRYIRGEADWVSSMEGGTIYRSDRWGTRNTATGEYYQGQPYNYFNYTGKNPKYNEQMEEIDTRELYEKHKVKLP